MIEPKVVPQLFINDVTPETLSTQIHEQGGKLSILSDEGGIMETLSGLYSGGSANIDIVLKGIDGGHCRVRRKDKHFDIEPLLTFVLAVQPTIIQNMASKKAFAGNGMMERWLFVIPKSKLGFREHDKPSVSEATKRSYHAKISELLSISNLDDPLQRDPVKLTLSNEALQDWKQFQRLIEIELRQNGKFRACLGWGGKICGFTLRIAGILHIAEHSIFKTVIESSTMRSAIELANLLCDHAVAAFEAMSLDEVSKIASKAFKWIQEKGETTFPQSAFTKALERIGNVERRQGAIKELIDRNIIRQSTKSSTGGRPSNIYEVNPYILQRGDYRKLLPNTAK